MPLKHSVKEITLKSGAKGLLIDVPDSTVVAYHIHFRAGNDYAERSVQQTAHIMEHLAFGANAVYQSSEEFSQEFSKNGASRGATTWDRSMSYVAEAAAMEWDRILDLIEIAITKPKFMQKSLDAEKGNVREELVGQANNHWRVLWQNVYRAMGSDSFLDLEKIETIDRVQLSDIKKHHKYTHTLKNMRFTVAGDLLKHEAEITSKLNQWELLPGERLPVRSVKIQSSTPVHIFRQDLSNLMFVFRIMIDRDLSLKEQTALGGLNHILTGTFHSRIFGKARSAGICYSMGSSSGSDISGVSSWNMHGQVGIDNAEKLFEMIVNQLQDVVNGGVSEKELEEAKQYATGGYQMRGQTVNALSNWYSGEYFDYGIIDPLQDSQIRIQETTTKDIKELAKEFIQKGHWTLGGIGNISKERLGEHYAQLSVLFDKKVE